MSEAEGGRLPPTVHGRIRAAARADPGALAVADPVRRVTYAELDGLANGLAHELRAAGVAPGARVGLCHRRSVVTVIGALAILKAGAAYVALDPAYPDARLEEMIADAAAAIVLTDASVSERLGARVAHAIDLDSACHRVRSEPPDDDTGGADADADPGAAAAYVVYTSGSTGAPKGVVVTHDNLLNLVDWHGRAFAVGRADRAAVLASPAFDASVWELWPALAAGASLLVPDARTPGSPRRLRDWLIAQRITIAFVATPLAELLLAMPWPDDTALRVMLTGGDVLHRRPRPGTPFVVVNNYGVAEATVVSTSGVVAPATGPGQRPSIGRPIDGTVLYVLDAAGVPVPTGEAGELAIAGAGVARGYFDRGRLTAERFGPDPFATDHPQRWYRTGDLVRARPDGEYEFLGRVDDQVQIRGQRVELDEVAAVLSDHPAVGRAVVTARERVAGDLQLVAYVEPATDGFDPIELRAHVASRLPRHMVPAVFVALDRVPLTSNGKIDRDALPAPESAVHADQRGRTPTERAVGAIIEELLALGAVGRDDNFFELGGHSLLAAQLVARLEEQFAVEVDLLAVFDHPTAAGIATVIDGDTRPLHAVADGAGS